MVAALLQLFAPLYGEDPSKKDFVPSKHADKVDVLLDALQDILFLLNSFGKKVLALTLYLFYKHYNQLFRYLIGPYGAFHCALVYVRILQAAKSRAKVPQFALDLEKVSFLCQRIRYFNLI